MTRVAHDSNNFQLDPSLSLPPLILKCDLNHDLNCGGYWFNKTKQPPKAPPPKATIQTLTIKSDYNYNLLFQISSLSISLSVSQLNIHQRVIVMHRWVPLVPNLHMRWNILRTRCVQKNNKKEIFITTWITSCVRWCMKPMFHIISKHLTGGTRSQHMSLHERKYAGKSCNRVDQLMCAMM